MKWILILFASSLLASCAAQEIVAKPPPRPFPEIEQYQGEGPSEGRPEWKISEQSGPIIYPRKLLSQGVQGWVVIRHSIESDGTTSDIEIIDSSPSGENSFDAISIRNISRLKFELIEGELPGPRVTGVTRLLKYELAD